MCLQRVIGLLVLLLFSCLSATRAYDIYENSPTDDVESKAQARDPQVFADMISQVENGTGELGTGWCLMQYSDPSVPAIIRRAYSRARDDSDRIHLAWVIAGYRDASLFDLIADALRSGSPDSVMSVMDAAARTRDPSLGMAVLPFVRNGQPEILRARGLHTIEQLTGWGHEPVPEIASALLDIWRQEPRCESDEDIQASDDLKGRLVSTLHVAGGHLEPYEAEQIMFGSGFGRECRDNMRISACCHPIPSYEALLLRLKATLPAATETQEAIARAIERIRAMKDLLLQSGPENGGVNGVGREGDPWGGPPGIRTPPRSCEAVQGSSDSCKGRNALESRPMGSGAPAALPLWARVALFTSVVLVLAATTFLRKCSVGRSRRIRREPGEVPGVRGIREGGDAGESV